MARRAPPLMQAELLVAAEQLTGEPILTAVRLAGAGNSRLYGLRTATGRYAFKCYPSLAEDHRNRLEREFAALSFLHRQPGWSIVVPRPIAADATHRLGLYSWIEGAPPAPRTAADLRHLAAAIGTFHGISTAPGAAALGDAAEATLSPPQITAQIKTRAALLQALQTEPALGEFLGQSFAPLLRHALDNLARRYAAAGMAPDQPLPRARQILSPSDFGLHNSLRLADDRLALLDFEYFGWDDPVRLIIDVLCHPAMQLNASERRDFLAATVPVFAGDPSFPTRLAALAPLIALRWALIVLNEFLPGHWRRRVQAGVGSHTAADWPAAKQTQLDKARAMLGLCEAFLRSDWN